MKNVLLQFLQSIELGRSDDALLLGITPGLKLYVEEIHEQRDDRDQIRIALDSDRSPVTASPRMYSEGGSLPADLNRPASPTITSQDDFGGARHRGLRSEERIDDLVYPLTVQEKAVVAKKLNLALPPPMVLGLIESYALGEARIAPDVHCVCRRLRAAYLLTERRREDGHFYDYDSQTFYLCYLHTGSTDFTSMLANPLPEAACFRPTECLVYGQHLVVLDCGSRIQSNKVHLWRINHES